MLKRSFLKSYFKTNLFNIPGWRTNKKLILFESDDWGNIRIPSGEVYQNLLNRGIRIDLSPYGNDSLESAEDIALLAEVLRKQRNYQGESPVFTINNIVVNPDFERIEKDAFQNYYYELFVDTYARFPKHRDCMKNWKQGIGEGLFHPQLHGREHLNIRRWMRALQAGSSETKWLFDQKMYALDLDLSNEDRFCYNKALDPDEESDRALNIPVVNDACEIFERIWGYKSKSFIAPNYNWDDVIEKALFDNDIDTIQGMRVQFMGDMKGGDIIKRHSMGQRNQYGQRYLTRNCYFEPSLESGHDWVSNCLREVESAFFWKKPAIICSHRVNYAGGISTENRDQNLKLLSSLIAGILKKWPEALFVSSDQLGQFMNQAK